MITLIESTRVALSGPIHWARNRVGPRRKSIADAGVSDNVLLNRLRSAPQSLGISQ
jgi:hypothetical protein